MRVITSILLLITAGFTSANQLCPTMLQNRIQCMWNLNQTGLDACNYEEDAHVLRYYCLKVMAEEEEVPVRRGLRGSANQDDEDLAEVVDQAERELNQHCDSCVEYGEGSQEYFWCLGVCYNRRRRLDSRKLSAFNNPSNNPVITMSGGAWYAIHNLQVSATVEGEIDSSIDTAPSEMTASCLEHVTYTRNQQQPVVLVKEVDDCISA